jgi:hypothetical protein
MASEVQAGVAAFLRLFADVIEEGNRPFNEIDGDYIERADPRDYVAICEIVDASLRANLDQANASHRQGFVRAMAHLITMCDGSCVLGADWDPWSATEAAFAAPTDASAVIRRASGASH